MKFLFPVLVLCTAAVVAVVLAIHFRVKRHLREQSRTAPPPESGPDSGKTSVPRDLSTSRGLIPVSIYKVLARIEMSKAVHIEAISQERSVSFLKQAGIVICASAVIAVCARIMVPLPFTPVPLTLANFGVLLVGLTLGSRRGFAAAALYLAWGAMGCRYLPQWARAAFCRCWDRRGATCGPIR